MIDLVTSIRPAEFITLAVFWLVLGALKYRDDEIYWGLLFISLGSLSLCIGLSMLIYMVRVR